MQKKVISKKKIPVKKATPTKNKFKKTNIEEILVVNFISLQKVMTNLSVDFNNLNSQISKLLELFETSAKTLTEKNIKFDTGKEEKKMVEKLDTLLDQNKIIAKSLTFLHEMPEEMPIPKSAPQLTQQPIIQQPMPSQRPPTALQPSPVKQVSTNQYQKSMPIKNQESLKVSDPKFIKRAKKNEKIF